MAQRYNGHQAISTGSDIQSIFFDMWRLDHADDPFAGYSRRYGDNIRFRA
jgi:hypothetical protein